MSNVTEHLSAKEAIDFGFEHFRELMGGGPLMHVLLEELEHLERDNVWRITIGFDVGRKQELKGTGLPGMFDARLEPVREFRTIDIDARTGDFKRMY